MSEEVAVVEPKEDVPLVHLVARNPLEMQSAQADLAQWLRQKLASVEHEIVELNAAVHEARTNGWATAALIRQRNKSVGQEAFYFKLLTAVDAGYTIIPEFPIDVFAIRVTRSGVRASAASSEYGYGYPTIDNERPDVAAVGEGEYKNPVQMVRYRDVKLTKSDGTEGVTKWTRPVDFQDEIVFPLMAARPVVMNATAEAMALKVFDQIGICLPTRDAGVTRRGDPLIIGQILGRREGYSQKCISFIIAWYLNLNDL